MKGPLMSKSIVITAPHTLNKDEARRRVDSEIDQLKRAYVDKFAYTEVHWTGDAAENPRRRSGPRARGVY
jgi:hypothetical protein